jgi:hypothetical protein
MKFYYVLFLSLITHLTFSQNSIIKGNVIEEKTGKTLPGVNVIIKETKFSTITDLDGNYIIKNIPPGKYEIEFSYFGFQTKIVSEVVTTANETTDVNTSLIEKANVLDEVVITKTKAKAESVKSLLLMQKNNASVSDGVSAETIKKTPDKTTSDVLKRISGASIQDNKFVIIRGLNDRYNTAYINGAPLPSSEPDRKAFSFDIFPSNMLDNLIITKTATPDLPGEFAGGVVQINTKSVSDKNFQSISFGSGYNTITTGKNQVTYKGGKTDFLGFDDGTRSLSPAIPDNLTFVGLNYTQKAEIAKNSTSDWALKNQSFSPNLNFQYTIGHNVGKLGMLMAVTYSKSNNYNETSRYDFESQLNAPSVKVKDLLDHNYTTQVLAGALANFSYKFNQFNTITFKNIYSLNSDDKVIERFGTPAELNTENPLQIYANTRWFTSNKIYSGQLNGDHFLPDSKVRFSWVGSWSKVDRSTPNLRRNIYTKWNNYLDPSNPDPLDLLYTAQIANGNTGPDYGGGIFYSENHEKIYSFKTDVSKKFNFGDNFSNEVKVGLAVQDRKRDFSARQLGYNKLDGLGGLSFDSSLLYLNDSQIFNPNNFGILPSGLSGFTLYDGTKYFDSYNASSSLNSSYVMLDNKIHKVRFVWGVRVEDYHQKLNTLITRYDELNLDNKQTDILPSFNFIYGINKNQNLRISYSKTLNRPEFRELAPFAFYDFQTQFVTSGSPDLKIASIKNFDIRYEIFPGKGQLFSISYFTKNFTNPIELIAGVNNKEITYRNATSGKTFGIELEFRTLLSSIFNEESTILKNTTLFSNIALINSSVDVSNVVAANDIEKSRMMQGQSPYVLNAGLQYLDNGWSLSINYNKVGSRIAIVGNSEAEPTLWEKSRAFLDMQFSKSFSKNKYEIKLNLQNLLAQKIIYYNNNDIDTNVRGIRTFLIDTKISYDEKKDDLIWSTNSPRVMSLSFTYNF